MRAWLSVAAATAALILLADEASAAEIAQLDETKYGQDISGIAKAALAGAAIGGIGSGLTDGDSNAVLVGAVSGARNANAEEIYKEQKFTECLEGKGWAK